MKIAIEAEKLFSTNLRNVYACLKDSPCAARDIVSKACKKGMSFPHPREDVRKSLAILEITGIADKKVSGLSHFFELSENAAIDPENIYEITRGVSRALDELGSDWTEMPVEDLRHALADLRDKDFHEIMDLLAKKRKIRIENGRVIKNITTYTYKKTSD
ncbi:MAG: hypothetical protein WC788_06745 [Candidatus Paceibacterota bacterium]|jgi:hypothetical protein